MQAWDEKSCSLELATTGNRSDRRHGSLSELLEALIARPDAVSRQTERKIANEPTKKDKPVSIIFCSRASLVENIWTIDLPNDLMERFANRSPVTAPQTILTLMAYKMNVRVFNGR